jgi:hypothetical protein
MSRNDTIQNIIITLSLPIIIFNWLGGVVAGIWLAILGKWSIIIYGLIAAFTAHFLLGFVLMLGLIFGAPAIYFVNKNYKIPAMFFGFLSLVVTIGIISFWCLAVFFQFMKNAEINSWVPLAIWSYGVATIPLQYLASKEKDNEYTASTVFFTQLAYFIMLLSLILLDLTLRTSIIIFLVIMGLCLIFHTFTSVNEMRSKSTYSSNSIYEDDNYFNDDSDDKIF